jgi:hypothetical protein
MSQRDCETSCDEPRLLNGLPLAEVSPQFVDLNHENERMPLGIPRSERGLADPRRAVQDEQHAPDRTLQGPRSRAPIGS